MSSVKSESKSADDEWAGLIQKALEHARNFDWGLYTNTQLDMANLLHREGRHRYELELLFWVLYLDINGPENQSGCDAVLLKEFPPFDPSSGMIAPVIAERAESLISMLELDTGTVRTLFLDCATKRRNKLMPISPDNAWNELQNHNAKLQRRNEL